MSPLLRLFLQLRMSVLSGLLSFKLIGENDFFLILNIVTVNKLTINISNFQIIYTVGAKKTLKTFNRWRSSFECEWLL